MAPMYDITELNRVRSFGWKTLPVGVNKAPYRGFPWQSGKDWAALSGESGYGIVIPDGHVVLDLDSEEALKRFLEIFEETDISKFGCVVKTPRGYHIWLKTDDARWRTHAGQSVVEGLDVRAAGTGYVVGPGSFEGAYHFLG